MGYEKLAISNNRLWRFLRSGSGRFIPIRNLRHARLSVTSAFARKFRGRYMDLPFIPFEAINRLNQLFSREFVGIEIGAGMSTYWMAARVKSLTSYEWDAGWNEVVAARLAASGLQNTSLVFCSGHEHMKFNDIEQSSLDFAFIDGGPRSMCLFNLWHKVKSGGFLYLDNWDSDKFWCEGGYDARYFLAERTEEILSSEIFVDFVPGQAAVFEGILVKKR